MKKHWPIVLLGVIFYIFALMLSSCESSDTYEFKGVVLSYKEVQSRPPLTVYRIKDLENNTIINRTFDAISWYYEVGDTIILRR